MRTQKRHGGTIWSMGCLDCSDCRNVLLVLGRVFYLLLYSLGKVILCMQGREEWCWGYWLPFTQYSLPINYHYYSAKPVSKTLSKKLFCSLFFPFSVLVLVYFPSEVSLLSAQGNLWSFSPVLLQIIFFSPLGFPKNLCPIPKKNLIFLRKPPV